MNSKNKIAILGCGNGGMALSGYLAAKGYSVNIYESIKPSEDFLKFQKEKTIILDGDIKCSGLLNCITTDIREAFNEADNHILVVVPAYAHEPVFEQMLPYIKDGQTIVILPGNYGGLILRRMMAEHGIKKDVTICETSSLPFACRRTTYNVVTIYKQKAKLKMCTFPESRSKEALDALNKIMPIFIPAKNTLEVSLDNANCVLHPFPLILNYGTIEMNSKTFRHYIDGITPEISNVIERVDQERMNIGKAYGVNLMPVLDQLKLFYGQNDCTNIYDYVHSKDSPYFDIIGENIRSRYITEDIPFLVVPAVQLAKKAGVAAPLLEASLRMASLLHEVDYEKNGVSLKVLGMDSMSKEETIAYLK